jgi:hypothetical protein
MQGAAAGRRQGGGEQDRKNQSFHTGPPSIMPRLWRLF